MQTKDFGEILFAQSSSRVIKFNNNETNPFVPLDNFNDLQLYSVICSTKEALNTKSLNFVLQLIVLYDGN